MLGICSFFVCLFFGFLVRVVVYPFDDFTAVRRLTFGAESDGEEERVRSTVTILSFFLCCDSLMRQSCRLPENSKVVSVTLFQYSSRFSNAAENEPFAISSVKVVFCVVP